MIFTLSKWFLSLLIVTLCHSSLLLPGTVPDTDWPWMNAFTSNNDPPGGACSLSERSWVKVKLGELPKVTQLERANLSLKSENLTSEFVKSDTNHSELLLNHHKPIVVYYQMLIFKVSNISYAYWLNNTTLFNQLPNSELNLW